jgi:hypothetical protein
MEPRVFAWRSTCKRQYEHHHRQSGCCPLDCLQTRAHLQRPVHIEYQCRHSQANKRSEYALLCQATWHISNAACNATTFTSKRSAFEQIFNTQCSSMQQQVLRHFYTGRFLVSHASRGTSAPVQRRGSDNTCTPRHQCNDDATLHRCTPCNLGTAAPCACTRGTGATSQCRQDNAMILEKLQPTSSSFSACQQIK